MEFETVIGLEVHVQLKTKTKLFCGCANAFGEEPNSLTCPVCTGQPGVLPVLNQEALLKGIKAGLALSCAIPKFTKFDRKNYFYPDLPKGYQISQFDAPIAENGCLDIKNSEKRIKRIGVTRAHLEEDAGKALHPAGIEISNVDLNRAGVPLLEIVSEPEIFSPEEAYSYLAAMKRLMQYIGASDCDMEKGSLRCDANISLKPKGAVSMGVKTEIKNLNSFHNVKKALAFEEIRQREVLESGGTIKQETRMWREDDERTEVMRSKEQAHDYRYFPEPDLPPFLISRDHVNKIKASLPEPPMEKFARFLDEYGVSEYDCELLTADREIADYFEVCAKGCRDPKEASKWIQTSVLKELNERNLKVRNFKASADQVATIIMMVKKGRISHQAGRKVLSKLALEGGEPELLVKEMGLEQVSDLRALESMADEVIIRCSQMVEEYRGGKETTLNALVGQVMKASKGKANPKLVRDLLIRKIRGQT